MNITETAGWTGFTIGLLLGVLVTVLLWRADSPGCYEDQFVAWDGDEHTMCINIDDYEEAVIDYHEEALSQEGR